MARWTRTLFHISLAVLMPATIDPNRADEAPRPNPLGSRVRTNDRESAALLEEGLRRSSTIRRLVADVQASDVLVVLATSNERTLRGLTQLTSAEGGVRILITRVTGLLIRDERIAVLGHELQHVHEIAAAPEITDQAGVRRLFDRIGIRMGSSGDRYETVAAIEVERRVLNEVRGAR